jgi:hypothetical protein
MNEKWKELYGGLCDDTDHIQRSGAPGTAQTESLFKSCLSYWGQCKALVQAEGFDNDMDEIDFFKSIKPQFTGQLECYMLVYQHQLFCPVGDAAEIAAFTDNERRKITRFRVAHQSFIRYYTEGQTDQDEAWFLRRHRPADPDPYLRVFDRDNNLLTAADWKLTVLAGNACYEQFLSTGDVARASARVDLRRLLSGAS